MNIFYGREYASQYGGMDSTRFFWKTADFTTKTSNSSPPMSPRKTPPLLSDYNSIWHNLHVRRKTNVINTQGSGSLASWQRATPVDSWLSQKIPLFSPRRKSFFPHRNTLNLDKTLVCALYSTALRQEGHFFLFYARQNCFLLCNSREIIKRSLSFQTEFLNSEAHLLRAWPGHTRVTALSSPRCG